jgi:hypothetical protein
MGFVYPYFLFALLTIAIPIIIHLFHFRRFKTVYFTNVRFLKEVQEQTSNRQKIRKETRKEKEKKIRTKILFVLRVLTDSSVVQAQQVGLVQLLQVQQVLRLQ